MSNPDFQTNYNAIRKIILKNTQVKHFLPSSYGLIEMNPTQLAPTLLQTINIQPEIVIQLANYFRRKFDEEKNETESAAGRMGTKAHDPNQTK